MTNFELLILAISLTFDTFAVSVGGGISMPTLKLKKKAMIIAFFGVFQAAYLFAGWFIGDKAASFIVEWDHWVAFAILTYLGGKMFLGALKGDSDEGATGAAGSSGASGALGAAGASGASGAAGSSGASGALDALGAAGASGASGAAGSSGASGVSGTSKRDFLCFKRLAVLATATSIDAIAVGASLAMLDISLQQIGFTTLMTFIATAVASFIGLQGGSKLGHKAGKKAEIWGGVILIVIGMKILIEHVITF